MSNFTCTCQIRFLSCLLDFASTALNCLLSKFFLNCHLVIQTVRTADLVFVDQNSNQWHINVLASRCPPCAKCLWVRVRPKSASSCFKAPFFVSSWIALLPSEAVGATLLSGRCQFLHTRDKNKTHCGWLVICSRIQVSVKTWTCSLGGHKSAYTASGLLWKYFTVYPV